MGDNANNLTVQAVLYEGHAEIKMSNTKRVELNIC